MEDEKSNSNPSDGLGENIPKIRALPGRTSGPTRRSTKGQWTPEEDEILKNAVAQFKGKNWKKIAECFKDRSDVQCLHRWQKVLNPELIKGPWSKEEDEIIVELVKKYGPKKWSTIAQHLPGRIGKQCRERWHNHLNPSINKEAWTQEEEFALIRAHQIYGNRWAELTKFLPGRTDNAIKNHWNSSVKKKLDSYLKSGLLGQFPVLPDVGNSSPPKVATTSRMQNDGDDSVPKGTQGEEVSDCSQDSNIAGSSEPGGETANVVLHQRQNYENSGSQNEDASCPPPCEDLYYASLDAVSISFPDIPQHEGCSSQYMEQTSLNDPGDSSNSATHFATDFIPDVSSLGMGQDSSQLQADCVAVGNSNDVSIPCQTSVGLLDASCSMGYSGIDSDKMRMLITDEECCRVLFSDPMHEESLTPGDYTNGNNKMAFSGSTLGFSPSSNAHISEAGQITASLSCPPNSDYTSRISSSLSSVPAHSASINGCSSLGHTSESNRVLGPGLQVTSEDHGTFEHSPCMDNIVDFGMEEHQDVAKDVLKLVPVNNFCCGSDNKQICPQSDQKPNERAEQEKTGALCYEPPRFPSLDIPFFSCDLIQYSSDMQQEFSPLGIRQLMVNSMSPLTPFRLWDSPSRDDSPDAVLKSAARTFTGTPSILKKRNRDLLSPLSDRRIDKKLETDMASTLSRDFSRLDVVFNENENKELAVCSNSSMPQTNSEVSNDDRTNCEKETRDEVERNELAISDEILSENDGSGLLDKITGSQVSIGDEKMVSADAQAGEDVQQLPGVLIEHDINDLLIHSPHQVGVMAEKTLEAASNHANFIKSSTRNPCKGTASHSINGKEQGSESAGGECLQYATSSSSAPQKNLCECDNAGTDSGFESMNIFAATSFKRSIESPSAWKSPWFLNTFLPNPSMEDISFFLSPGDRSYDALGLMKQISEQTASAYANAQEVLVNETPKTKGKDKSNQDRSPNQECNHLPDQIGNYSQLGSNVLMERRTLDFSECGTPGKVSESGKSSAVSLSSPSSYLLKNCR